MTASISVKGVNKSFALAEYGGGPVSLSEALRLGRKELVTRHVDALKDVSFTISPGERVGIIGRNGAGKTTLLSLIAGITEPSSGAIEVRGDLHAMLSIGAVLRDEATGRENIYLDGAVHGRTRGQIDALVEEIIAFAELGEFIDRPVRTYSSGMKARLAFSMGAFIKTDILIIDETLSVGDATFSRKATRRMKEMTQAGQIVVAVSHSLSTIVEICNRCLWLDNGRLVMDGAPAVVTEAYLGSVEKADAEDLARKFGSPAFAPDFPDLGIISAVSIHQNGQAVLASAKAFLPAQVRVSGSLNQVTPDTDLILSILRVDGTKIWSEKLSSRMSKALNAGEFGIEIDFKPFVLGENLYRLDAVLMQGGRPIASRALTFEVRDEQGQFGGKPMLYYPMKLSGHIEKDA